MSVTHRTFIGQWEECEHPESCESPFHFPDATPAEMRAMPMTALLPLLEVMDPPTRVGADGEKRWLESQYKALHRDYDLPALIYPDGSMYWMQIGVAHRANDMPQSVHADGHRSWYRNGEYYADTRRPESVPKAWRGEIW